MVTSTSELEIHASAALLESIGVPTSDGELELRFLLVAKLVELGRVSIGRGAEICSLGVAAFMQKLGSIGVPVINYSLDELKDELRDG